MSDWLIALLMVLGGMALAVIAAVVLFRVFFAPLYREDPLTEPSPDDDIAAGRVVQFGSVEEMDVLLDAIEVKR